MLSEDVKNIEYVERMKVYKFFEALSYKVAVIHSQND
jgi:hypothetical protein